MTASVAERRCRWGLLGSCSRPRAQHLPVGSGHGRPSGSSVVLDRSRTSRRRLRCLWPWCGILLDGWHRRSVTMELHRHRHGAVDGLCRSVANRPSNPTFCPSASLNAGSVAVRDRPGPAHRWHPGGPAPGRYAPQKYQMTTTWSRSRQLIGSAIIGCLLPPGHGSNCALLVGGWGSWRQSGYRSMRRVRPSGEEVIEQAPPPAITAVS